MKTWKMLMIRFVKDVLIFMVSVLLIMPALFGMFLKLLFDCFHEISQFYFSGLKKLIKELLE